MERNEVSIAHSSRSPRMSSNPHRKPSRPPPPTFSPPERISDRQRNIDNHENSPLSSTPSSPSLSSRGSNQGSLPDYNNIVSGSSNRENCGPPPLHRRGSDGDRHPQPNHRQRQRQRKRSNSQRSRSVKHRVRPSITIVAAGPMSQHPAFADGAKGGYIPPEAPPSYDEAINAPLPRNPSFTDPDQPDHISQQRRVFPTVETVSPLRADTAHTSQDREPNSVDAGNPSRFPSASLFVNLPPETNSNQNNSEGSPSIHHNSSINRRQETSGSAVSSGDQNCEASQETPPIPTPRTRRAVSLHVREPSSSQTPVRPSHILQKPPVPPKKPGLKSPSGNNTQQITTSDRPDVLNLLEDNHFESSNRLPEPMLPSPSRKLPPPPKPRTLPPAQPVRADPPLLIDLGSDVDHTDITGLRQPNPLSPLQTQFDELDGYATVTSNPNVVASTVQASMKTVQSGSKPSDESSMEQNVDKENEQEPVYASVKKTTAVRPRKNFSPNHSGQTDAQSNEMPGSATEPPPVPASRPPLEDYTGIFMDNNEKPSDTVDARVSNISPTSSIDTMCQSVRFHKVPNNSDSVKPSKPERVAPPHPTKPPPPLPASRPVGSLPKEGGSPTSSPSITKRRASVGDGIKKKKGLKAVRRKSTHFREKSMKIFQKKPETSESPVGISNEAFLYSHPDDKSNEQAKPKKVPPPRPALPASLQKKLKQTPESASPESSPLNPVPSTSTSSKEHLDSGKSNIAETPKRPSKPSRPAPVRPAPAKQIQAVQSATTNSLTNMSNEKDAANLKQQPVAKPRRQPPALQEVEVCDSGTPPVKSPSPKPKPTRPPPAMLPTPPIPIRKKGSSPEKKLKEIKAEVDVKMKQYAKGEEFYIAIEDYEAVNFTDISFRVGEKVSVLKRIDEQTLFGRNEEGEEGPFPEKYVKLENEVEGNEPSLELNPNSNNNSNKGTDSRFVVALFSYYSTNVDDLNFNEGERIEVLEEVSESWLKGRIEERNGIFPSNFVKPITPKPKPMPKPSLKCVALFDFDGEGENEISFKVGSEVEIVKRINNQWLEGICSGKQGIFPASYVKMLQKSPSAKPMNGLPRQTTVGNLSVGKAYKTKTSQRRNSLPEAGTAVALYSFQGQDSSELSFDVDDVIHLTGEVNSEWLQGTLNEKSGIFPSKFVRIV